MVLRAIGIIASALGVRLVNEILNALQWYPMRWLVGRVMDAPTEGWVEVARWALAFLVALVIWWWIGRNKKNKYKKSVETRPSEEKISFRAALDYLGTEAKFALPTRKRPMRAIEALSAYMLESVCRNGKIKIWGRRKNTSEYRLITPLELEMLSIWGSVYMHSIVAKTDHSKFSDKPENVEITDLLVDRADLVAIFPPQSRLERSRAGRWFRRVRLGPIAERNNDAR